SGLGIVHNAPAPSNRVARVDVCVASTTGRSDRAALLVVKGGPTAGAVIARIRISPSRLGPRVGGIAPTPVNISADVSSPAPAPRRSPAARSIPAPRPPPRVIVGVAISVADAEPDAPAAVRAPGQAHTRAVGVRCTIPVASDVGRVIPACAVDYGLRAGRNHGAVITRGVANVNDIGRRPVKLDVNYVI